MIRVIAVDLDDTLIAPDKHIPKENIMALQEAMQRGVRVVIATARGWFRTEAIYRDLGLDTPAICSSGARIVDAHGRDQLVRTLPLDLARAICQFATEQKIALRVYVGAEVWNNLEYDPLVRNQLTREKIVPDLPLALTEAPYQIFTKGRRETELLVQQFGLHGAGYVTSVMQYSDNIPEVAFLHPQATKGAALAALCQEWGVPREQVMALGDSTNDLPMIEWAGIGVAMSWASETVKKQADYVPTAGHPAGVAEAVRSVLNSRETSTAG